MNPMDAFYLTVAIVAGILSPIFLVLLLAGIVKSLGVIAPALEIKAEEIKKRPPFDDAEINVNPATNVMTVRLKKGDEVIYEGASSRRTETEV